MNAQTHIRTQSFSDGLILSAALSALLGIGLVVLGGHVQASTLHDAAHDVRHATGFPCH